MRIDVVTIFPEYLEPLDVSLVGKARQRGVLDVRVHDLRDWTHDRHNTVDDTPYGGGPGMVMKPEPWGEALDAVLASGTGITGSTENAEGPGDVGGAGRGADGGRGGPVLVVPTPSGHRPPGDRGVRRADGRPRGVDR
jgi:tRNA (guanine37-N1)-methyltransferase